MITKEKGDNTLAVEKHKFISDSREKSHAKGSLSFTKVGKTFIRVKEFFLIELIGLFNVFH